MITIMYRAQQSRYNPQGQGQTQRSSKKIFFSRHVGVPVLVAVASHVSVTVH
jgi:hypothetical protein